jgi:branched-chain amino acid transport system ATP-binding protein
MNKILEVNNLYVSYGTVRALENVSFFVEKGEIVALVGLNGAGKSTALKAICGLVPVNDGEIQFQGENIKGFTPDKLVRKGLSLVPEGRRIFSTMTVLENLEMGAFTLPDNQKSVIKDRMEKAFSLFPVLQERKKQRAGTLSGGEQQMLAIGRALMLNPALLLLDEPSMGLSPDNVRKVFEKLVEINNTGTSILIVEQNIISALEICNRGYVFEIGQIAHEGTKEHLMNDEKIKSVFLGKNIKLEA